MRRWLTRLVGAALFSLWGAPGAAAPLESRLAALEAGFPGELGVHIRELGSGRTRGWRDEEPWYLASLVKVPVAIELMARVEAGALSLDERLTLAESDYVDGAGPTNWAPPGARLSLETLLEAMLTVSDNTATDMLIRHLGLPAINTRARALVPEGLGPITTLVDVRRHVYAQLHHEAFALDGLDFIELQKRDSDQARLDWLSRRLGVPRSAWRLPSLDAAFDAYYGGALNSGRLDGFAELLAALAEGQALGPEATERLLRVMARTRSGERRLKAGFGPAIPFAHKTGTKRRRACDAGIADTEEHRLVVVACVRGVADVALAERTLRDVGRVLREEW
ncbi:class A beta-lactamase-related serine hydrolase [Halomonas sp. LR5S13]|uniref:serine hydrolase n=1 Tax=Halomonas rhizosphaerae TaxID=3043296 RepID=UPI0024A863E7|nr:serine hydrolase [Halomonas rhizosphaerae]MDI5920062.1 class A beta-lactamase-related serine hydrolase [Halomonas rhizosphaerae]